MKVQGEVGKTLVVVFKAQPFVPVPDSRGGISSCLNTFAGIYRGRAADNFGTTAFQLEMSGPDGRALNWIIDDADVLMFCAPGEIYTPERQSLLT